METLELEAPVKTIKKPLYFKEGVKTGKMDRNSISRKLFTEKELDNFSASANQTIFEDLDREEKLYRNRKKSVNE